jgi:hypothetical protein
MTYQSTPEFYQPLAETLARAGVAHSPAELHGVICGLLSTGFTEDDPGLLGVLAAHVDLDGHWSEEARQLLLGLRDQVRQAYEGEGLDLVLLLPEHEELEIRVATLGHWCEGFLAGFGTGSAGVRDADLPTGLQEALSDLVAVSHVELPADDGAEEEDMFEQVSEHCRVAAMMIFTELALRARQSSKQEKPVTRH